MLLWYCKKLTDFAFTPKKASENNRCLLLCSNMAQAFAKDFYNGQAWKQCRAAYVKYRRGLCERCLKRGQYSAGVIVHHKIVLTPANILEPAVTLNFDNLELLCRDCHADAHKPGKRYKVDELGRIITI